MEFNLSSVAGGFVLDGGFVSAERFGTGHINDTFKMYTTNQTYILQRINTMIFKQPELLMDNFVRVCSHIESKIAAEKKNRSCLPPPGVTGHPFPGGQSLLPG